MLCLLSLALFWIDPSPTWLIASSVVVVGIPCLPISLRFGIPQGSLHEPLSFTVSIQPLGSYAIPPYTSWTCSITCECVGESCCHNTITPTTQPPSPLGNIHLVLQQVCTTAQHTVDSVKPWMPINKLNMTTKLKPSKKPQEINCNVSHPLIPLLSLRLTSL